MKLWLDAHQSPALAVWLRANYGIEAHAVRHVGHRDALDRQIFLAARQAGAAVMTKDRDFAALVDRLGPPPQVIWPRCGNTSNAYLRRLLAGTLPRTLDLLQAGEPLVEIGERW